MKRLTIAILIALTMLWSMAAFAQTTTTRRPAPNTSRSTTATPNIPAGTRVQVRINETLSSATSQTGDRFTGTVTQPVVVAGRTVAARGDQVEGRVRHAKASGRLTDAGELTIELTEIISSGRRIPVYVQPAELKGESHQKGNVYKIGGGAALGAIIGGLAGGGKGAAIGAGVGAAAGTGAAAATGKSEATVEAEAVLEFTAVSPSESSRTGTLQRRDGTTTDDTYGDDRNTSTGTASTTNRTTSGTTTGTTGNTTSNTSSNTAGTSNNPGTYGNTTSGTGYGTDDQMSVATRFTVEDRRTIRACLQKHEAELPTSLTRRSAIPATMDRQMMQGSVLPAEMDRRVQYLPRTCDRQLPRMGNAMERVLYGGRVMLLDANNRILDAFDLYGQE